MILPYSDTIVPWVLGALLIMALITLSVTLKAWRDAKRSPYFFLRVQAAKRMQHYLVATLALFLVTFLTAAYAWPESQQTEPQIARLSSAKPAVESQTGSDEPDILADASPASVEITLSPVSNRVGNAVIDLEDPLLKPSLPEEYNQFEAKVDLKDSTEIGKIAFSTRISDDYRAIDMATRFGEGYFTLYATFDYDQMADGMTWSWVWRRNGEVIDGGNQMWSYGDDGPGYVYFRPEEGFQLGEYQLEIWVNSQLQSQSSFTVIDSVRANN